MPLGLRAASLQLTKYVVMRVIGGQMKAEVEPGRVQQPEQCGKSGLPQVTLICRDHGDGDSCSFGQFSLAHAGLEPGELQECGRWRR
jgi:hypothetical protein